MAEFEDQNKKIMGGSKQGRIWLRDFGASWLGDGMTETTKFNPLWPNVDTINSARSARMYGVWAAVYGAVVTALTVVYSIATREAALGFTTPWYVIDVLIIAGIGFGIFKESRAAAVIGLVWFVGGKVHQLSTGNMTKSGLLIAVLLTWCYAISVRGNFSLHRLRHKKKKDEESPEPSLVPEEYAELLMLDDLRKRGILTDAEFEAQKKKLLEGD